MKSEDTHRPAACARVRGRLEQLLDGGLRPLEAARDEGHLEVCAGCAAARDGWQSLVGELRGALASAPPPNLAGADLTDALAGLDERLALARAPRRPRPGRDSLLAGLVAAAAAVLALLALRGLGAQEAGLADYTAAGRSLRLPVEFTTGVGPLDVLGARGRE